MPTLGTASAATGVISLVLLTAVVVLGITVNRQGRLPGLPGFAGLRLHRYLALFAVGFIAVHVLTAVSEPYARVGLAAAVVPSLSLWLGLGAVAFDLLLALVVTSLLRRHLGRTAWRAVHWLAYACWPAALAHSVGSGPGLHQSSLFDLAAACVLAVMAAGSWRLAGTAREMASARRVRRVRAANFSARSGGWPPAELPAERWHAAAGLTGLPTAENAGRPVPGKD